MFQINFYIVAFYYLQHLYFPLFSIIRENCLYLTNNYIFFKSFIVVCLVEICLIVFRVQRYKSFLFYQIYFLAIFDKRAEINQNFFFISFFIPLLSPMPQIVLPFENMCNFFQFLLSLSLILQHCVMQT